MVSTDGLISSLDVQLTDSGGRPAQSRTSPCWSRWSSYHFLVFLLLFFYSHFYCLFCDGRNVQVVNVGGFSWVKHNRKTARNITATCWKKHFLFRVTMYQAQHSECVSFFLCLCLFKAFESTSTCEGRSRHVSAFAARVVDGAARGSSRNNIKDTSA